MTYELTTLRATRLRATVSRRVLLEQLAEESAELAQAALKLIRAEGLSANYTPISIEDAECKMVEELADVLTVWRVLNTDESMCEPLVRAKLTRWHERVFGELEK